MLKGLFSTAQAPRAAAAHAYPLKLNLGCGYKKIEGYLNVDKFGDSQPDLVMDLEVLPWPFPDSSVTHVVMSSILEHIGQEPNLFLRIIQELWRVCSPGAEIIITVPHPRHDHFMGDPTHVRPILPATLQAFDQELNREWIANGNAATPLGVQLKVDFRVDSVQFVLDEEWLPRFVAGEVTSEQVIAASRSQTNVIAEFTFKWVAYKPCRG
jgi:SAM-dependent methyltransferase